MSNDFIRIDSDEEMNSLMTGSVNDFLACLLDDFGIINVLD